MKKTLSVAILAALMSPVFAHPAKSKTVLVDVTNRMNHPIIVYIDNNWGSVYTGDHPIAASGATDEQGNKRDVISLILNSNNDEEYYTISYQGASCKIDYPLIRDRFNIKVDITGSDASPRCELH